MLAHLLASPAPTHQPVLHVMLLNSETSLLVLSVLVLMDIMNSLELIKAEFVLNVILNA